jgi:hypothetical protein
MMAILSSIGAFGGIFSPFSSMTSAYATPKIGKKGFIKVI